MLACSGVPQTQDAGKIEGSGGGGGSVAGGGSDTGGGSGNSGGGVNVGGGGGWTPDAGPPAEIHSFIATPATLPAGGGSVTLAWDVSAATSISIDKGVGTVTGMSSASVSVTASTTWTLSATGHGGTATKTASVSVATTLTLHGRVLDMTRVAATGIPVVVTGQPSVITDSDGAFTVLNVTPPYDITVVDPTAKVATVYKGLTLATPSLVLWRNTPYNRAAMSLSGFVTGGQSPYCAGLVCTTVFFESPEGYGITGTSSTGAYSMTTTFQSTAPVWRGPSATVGALHAFELQFPAGGSFPTGYLGYGEVPNVTVADKGSFTQNVAMSPIGTLTLAGSVVAPSGYSVIEKQLILKLTAPDRVGLRLADDTSTNAGFNFVGPEIHDSTFTVSVVAGDAKGTTGTVVHPRINATTTSLDLEIPAGPALILPVNNATGLGLGTTFSWQPFTGGVNLLVVQPSSSSSSNPTFAVFTPEATASIPDLRSIGLTLPSSAAYYWSVYGYAPVASIDAMATDAGTAILFGTRATEYSTGRSADYTFTTQ